jgi:PTS system beta-glucosides-specific IIC component
MDYSEIAQEILKNVGGKENVTKISSCVTRLRFELKSPELFNEDALKKVQTVMGTTIKGGQHQVVIGGKVLQVYDAMRPLLGEAQFSADDHTQWKDKTIPARILEYIAGTIQPTIPVLLGAGMVMSVVALIDYLHILPHESTTYVLLNTFSAAGFYFLPVLIAFAAARKIGCNPYVAAMIAGILLHPDFIALVNSGSPITFLGIPVSPQSYGSSITPMILVIPVMYFVEKFAKKIMPDMLKTILTPAVTLLVTGALAIIILAPLANILSAGIGVGFKYIYTHFSIVGGFIIGGVVPFLVLTGLHNAAAIPIVFMELANEGYSILYPLLAFANIAVGGAAFGVALKTKNKNFKSVAYGAAFTGAVGITEPSLFGVLLFVKRPFIAVGVTSAITGALTMVFKVKAIGLSLAGLGGIPIFFGDTFGYAVVIGILSFVMSSAISYFVGFKDIPEDK